MKKAVQTAADSERKKKSRVFIVDDHPLVRERLVALIEEQEDMEICGAAQESRKALDLIAASNPNVVTVEISLPKGPNGLELIKDLKTRFPAIRTLVLSMHDEFLYAERAIRAGAAGYLSKVEPSEKVLVALRQIIEGKIYLSENLTASIVGTFLGGRAVAKSSASVERLSDRELEVFELIGRGQTSRQISEDLRLDAKTIETYRGRIKSKLGLRSATELHQKALQWIAGIADSGRTSTP